MNQDRLAEFDINPERGFLPASDPMVSLPQQLAFIDEYARALPELIREGRPNRELATLRPLKSEQYMLMSEREVRLAAFRNYCFFASACALSPKTAPQGELPGGVAIPLYLLGRWLNLPPILQYYPYALYNWKRKDPAGPIVVENLQTIVDFVDIPDEPGFILPHVEINAKAAPAIRSALPLLEAIQRNDAELAESYLWEIGYSVRAMVETLPKIRKYCDPAVYYKEVRPYIQKFNGVIYHGVKAFRNEPQNFNGESGAQDSNLKSLDALLGVSYDTLGNEELARFIAFLDEAENYMPFGHRRFIRYLRKNSNVREFVVNSGHAGTKEAYNFCLERKADFRFNHLGLAIDYIHKPMPQEALGTFGTPFMEWLNWLRDETLAHRIA